MAQRCMSRIDRLQQQSKQLQSTLERLLARQLEQLPKTAHQLVALRGFGRKDQNKEIFGRGLGREKTQDFEQKTGIDILVKFRVTERIRVEHKDKSCRSLDC